MARFTPDEFVAALNRAAQRVPEAFVRATGKAALHVKRTLVAQAQQRVKRTPRARPGWIKYDVFEGDERATAEIRPRGGYAHLAELGSYKHPGGYQIPRANRRKPTLLNTPFGVFPRVHHPFIPAQPWFEEGARRADRDVGEVYEREVLRAIDSIF